MPPTLSLSLDMADGCPLIFTTKVDPEAKVALPVTLSIAKVVPGVSTPGATVPPLCTVKDLLVEPDTTEDAAVRDRDIRRERARVRRACRP